MLPTKVTSDKQSYVRYDGQPTHRASEAQRDTPPYTSYLPWSPKHVVVAQQAFFQAGVCRR